MGAEMGHHLGYPAGAANPKPAANQRNGTSAKTVITLRAEDSYLHAVPRQFSLPRPQDLSRFRAPKCGLQSTRLLAERH